MCEREGETVHIQACRCARMHMSLWVGREEAQHTHTHIQATASRQSLSPWNDMLYPTIEIDFLRRAVDFSPEIGSSLGQSSLHTASWYMGHAWVPEQQLCLHPDEIDTGRQAAVLPLCLPHPLWLSSHPYTAYPRTTRWLERFIPLQAPWLYWNDDRKRHCFIVRVLWLLCRHCSKHLQCVFTSLRYAAVYWKCRSMYTPYSSGMFDQHNVPQMSNLWFSILKRSGILYDWQ